MAEELQQRATSGLWVVAAEATATLALQRPQEPTMIIPRSVAARALMNGLEINHASFTSVNHVLYIDSVGVNELAFSWVRGVNIGVAVGGKLLMCSDCVLEVTYKL